MNSGPQISSSAGRLMLCTKPHRWPLSPPRSRYQRPPGSRLEDHRQRLAVGRLILPAHLRDQRSERLLQRRADVDFFGDGERLVLDAGRAVVVIVSPRRVP